LPLEGEPWGPADGTPHTHTVFVPTPLTPGPVQVLTFAQVTFAGQLFYGIDSGTIAHDA
jgi:hypothetical protein